MWMVAIYENLKNMNKKEKEWEYVKLLKTLNRMNDECGKILKSNK